MSLQDASGSPYSLTVRQGGRMSEFPLYSMRHTQEIEQFADREESSPINPDTAIVVSLEQFARKVDASKVSQNSRGV